MGGLAQFAQTLATFIVGPFGVSMITLAIGGVALLCALHAMRWSHLWETVFAGAILFSSAWVVTTFLGA